MEKWAVNKKSVGRLQLIEVNRCHKLSCLLKCNCHHCPTGYKCYCKTKKKYFGTHSLTDITRYRTQMLLTTKILFWTPYHYQTVKTNCLVRHTDFSYIMLTEVSRFVDWPSNSLWTNIWRVQLRLIATELRCGKRSLGLALDCGCHTHHNEAMININMNIIRASYICYWCLFLQMVMDCFNRKINHIMTIWLLERLKFDLMS